MPAFLYYLPGLTHDRFTREWLADSPLAGVLRDCVAGGPEFQRRLTVRNVHAHGPDQGNGLLIAPVPQRGHGVQPIGVHNERQEWHDCGTHWLGVDTELGIDPLDLLRPGALEGLETRLAGLIWQVPIIRRGGNFPTLPETLTRRGGKFERRLRREYEPIWAASGRIFDLAFRQSSAQFEEVFDLCCQMLAVNYRVGPDELSVLEAIDTENFRGVFEAVIDWPTVRQILESVTPGEPTLPSDPNAAASGPVTVPEAAS